MFWVHSAKPNCFGGRIESNWSSPTGSIILDIHGWCIVHGMRSSTMDFPRLSSTPSIHIHDCNNSQSFSSPGPMRIPTKSIEPPPPPLPPPRRIYDLDVGHDPGWHYENGAADTSTLAPINPSSSLFGGHHQRPDPVPRSARMSLEEPIDRCKKGLLLQSPKTRLKSEGSLLDESFRNTSLTSPDSV